MAAEHPDLPPVAVLMGPTASGKTRLAIDWAQALNGEIISVDSALVFRGMDIGTAKPTLAERLGVPHHLIDILDPAEAYSTGRFRDDALALVEAILARGRLPILVGGTMLYFNALFNGLAELPKADEAIRQQIDAEAAELGWTALHAELARVDPTAAARIHRNDPQRIQRALEVYRITGRPLSALFDGNLAALPFRPIKIVVAPADREALRARIAERFHAMLALGFEDEVRELYARGDLHAGLPAIRAVGYRQMWSFLDGECDRDTMVERAIIATRQFAKRQFTWLRREQDAAWFATEAPDLVGGTLDHLLGQMS